MTNAESVEVQTIAASFATVERQVIKSAGGLSWAEVLCETNAGPAKIADVQRALTAAGYNAAADGIFGPQTLRAMTGFQQANDLATGYLTIETVRALGLDPYT